MMAFSGGNVKWTHFFSIIIGQILSSCLGSNRRPLSGTIRLPRMIELYLFQAVAVTNVLWSHFCVDEDELPSVHWHFEAMSEVS